MTTSDDVKLGERRGDVLRKPFAALEGEYTLAQDFKDYTEKDIDKVVA